MQQAEPIQHIAGLIEEHLNKQAYSLSFSVVMSAIPQVEKQGSDPESLLETLGAEAHRLLATHYPDDPAAREWIGKLMRILVQMKPPRLVEHIAQVIRDNLTDEARIRSGSALLAATVTIAKKSTGQEAFLRALCQQAHRLVPVHVPIASSARELTGIWMSFLVQYTNPLLLGPLEHDCGYEMTGDQSSVAVPDTGDGTVPVPGSATVSSRSRSRLRGSVSFMSFMYRSYRTPRLGAK